MVLLVSDGLRASVLLGGHSRYFLPGCHRRSGAFAGLYVRFLVQEPVALQRRVVEARVEAIGAGKRVGAK